MEISKAIPVGVKDVKINGAFWAEKQEDVRNKIIPYQWNALNDNVTGATPSHAIENFRIAAGLSEGEFHGFVFQDSDVAKWLEAAAYSLMNHPDPELEAKADSVIGIIEKAQQEDGYLDTAFILKDRELRWTNLIDCHELYCAGHMMEAAAAFYTATGKDKLLRVMERVAGCIDSVFGPGEGKKKGYPGHEEVELALVKMYRATGNHKYLDMAKYFIDERGKQPHYFDVEADRRMSGNTAADYSYWKDWAYEYNQSHKPVREQDAAIGHAVRAMYLYTGMADVALETNDEVLARACEKLFDNVAFRQMYITGGIGSSAHGESFTFDYDLPNDTCYTETCASIGLVFFANRMLRIRRHHKYGDIIEQALYNGVLSGVSLDGQKFFYVNPLEVWPESANKRNDKRHVRIERQKWFGCACCPPNLARMVASLGEYVYTTDDSGVQVHLYVGSEADIRDKGIGLSVHTEYPWDGAVRITVKEARERSFGLSLRIPGWCGDYEISVNGNKADFSLKDGYACIMRDWSEGDEVTLLMDMPVKRMRANPELRYNAGKVALMRGPVVYCLEEADNGGILTSLRLPADAALKVTDGSGLFAGTKLIEADGMRSAPWQGGLYSADSAGTEQKTKLTAVPYFMWNNRGPGEMLVWIRE